MLPGMNPREMQKAMKRLGIRQEEIEAEEVIIRLEDKDIIIKNPNVSKVNMMGQETFQIVGNAIEMPRSTKPEISEDDIATVTEQTGCTREEASEALEEANGNLAEAILKLQKNP